MKKYFTLVVLTVLTCMSGSRALAQTKSYPSQTFTEEMDFTGFNVSWDSNNRSEIVWAAGGNYIAGIKQSGNDRSFASELEGIYYLAGGRNNNNQSSQDGKKNWAIGQIDNQGADYSYLQRSNNNDAPNGANLYLHNLKKGDMVKIWLVNGQYSDYACQMASGNTTIGQGTNLSGIVEFEITDNTVNEGRVTLFFPTQFSGVQKIQITTTKPYYNYDPGYEVYDFFEIGKSNNVYTGYTTNENAGFTLHGNPAKYLKLNNDAGLSLNNRIAVCETRGWTIKRGIRAPGYPSDGHTGNAWHNVSICNLYAGDRVEIFYTGVAPKFSSNGENGGYNGSNAFKDVKNDGEYNPDEEGLWKDQMIYSGMPLEGISSRNEGNLSDEEDTIVLLYKSFTYVMTEDGHLDLGLWNGNHTRILKVKIYSDHQATMIDESVEGTRGTRAFFDITGELKAKEHIVPGGLEVRVGNENKEQHAIVVESRRGPVSYVNAVDGFKLPGITGSVEEGININFSLDTQLPTTGTFYKFVALNSGKLMVRFNASSVNYYRYDIPGDAAYYDDGEGDQGPWLAEFNRTNEWTYNLDCPYYVMVSTDDGPEGAEAVWDPSSSSGSGSGGGSGEGDITLSNGNNYILELSQLSSFSDDDIVTFHITRENSYINNVGGLSDRNSYQVSYSFPVPTTGEGQTLDFDCKPTVGDIRALANNTGGVRVILQSVTSVTITLPSSGSGSGSSSGSGSGLSSGIDISGPKASSKTYGNGADGEFALYVEAGKTYYFYGGWTGNPSEGSHTTSPRNTNPYACGVAQLLDVTFEPDRDIHPLAKWVPSETPAVDDEHDATVGGFLADIIGYRSDEMTVKKMSGNIEGCEPFIENNKLKIRNITYKDGANPGGVILIKFGTYNYETQEVVYTKDDPVYALTVAYDANYHSETPTYKDEVRGHTWDFSTTTLQGLEWDLTKAVPVPTKDSDDEDEINDIYENISSQNYAEIKDYGTSTDNTSLLFKELNYTENGVPRSDWMFNYRLESGSNNYDPHFLNKYDMQGDNADMIWTTEGLVFKTSSNQSCMYNEFTGTDIHASANDPDRYVGILSGGSFIIPHLNANDRVIIYMGSGTDSGVEPEDMKFRITNALDALHNPIYCEYDEENETWKYDVYLAGGSRWMGAKGDNNYRGCYHFFAKEDGDMEFTLEGSNSMCKLYKIQIYSGRRIKTNHLVPVDDSPLYLVSKKGTEEKPDGTYRIQYLGKGESVGEPEMAGMTGNLADVEYELAALTDDKTSVHFTTTVQDKFGVFNMRLDDMERNNKYVADFAARNFPIGYYEEMPYPYTWDFTDLRAEYVSSGIGTNGNELVVAEDDLKIWDNWNMRVSSDESDGYIFAPGGQLYGGTTMFDETRGIGVIHNGENGAMSMTNPKAQNGKGDGGLAVGEDNTFEFVVPQVPKDAGVYVHVRKVNGASNSSVKSRINKATTITDFTYTGTDENGDEVFALKNAAKGDVNICVQGYEVNKIAVATDEKKTNIKGYASESRNHAIDASLLPYFTGKAMKSYLVSNPNYVEHTLTLTDVSNTERYVIPAETGYVIYNPDNANDKGEFNPFQDGKGFHLFVPDMHDDEESEGKFADVETNNGFMVPVLEERTGENKLKSFSSDGKKTNYVLSYKWYDLTSDGSTTGQQHTGDEMFYRVSREGINLRANSAYLVLDTESLGLKTSQGSTQSAKFTFIFADDLFGQSPGITTGIDDASQLIDNGQRIIDNDAEWYNLSGQKLNGMPTTKGLYIVNGKKVLVK